MLKLSFLLLLACTILSFPHRRAVAEPTPVATAKEITQQNPLIDSVARNDPDGLRNLLQRLEILTTGQRDSGPARSGSAPTAQEAAQIDANPLVRRAYANDPAATLALLRATNDALDRARHRGSVESPRRVALVIGNTGDSAWGTLGTVRNDTSLIATALGRQGFTLFGGHAWLDLDRRQLQQTIADFSRSITPDTVALVYYAGHGIQSRGRNFLVPARATTPKSEDDYDRELVAVDDVLLRQVQQASGRLNIIVLDACQDRSASLPGTDSRRAPQQSVRGFAPASPHASGTIVMYSTAPNTVARDSIGNASNSPFANAFATAIGEPGLEVRDVFDRVEALVDRATSHQQQPWISYSAIGKFYFSASGGSSVAVPSAVVDDGPFRCPGGGTTVTLDIAGGAVTGVYKAADPADPVMCRIVISAGETKNLLYNFFDAKLLLDQASIRKGMDDLLSRHTNRAEFEIAYGYFSRYLETWTRLGVEMLPIDGHYVRTVKFARASRSNTGGPTQQPPIEWLVWYDPAAGVFVKSERQQPGVTPSLGNGGMPGAFKVISLAPS